MQRMGIGCCLTGTKSGSPHRFRRRQPHEDIYHTKQGVESCKRAL